MNKLPTTALMLAQCELNSGFFDSEFRRPTQSVLQKWLREIHEIDVLVDIEYHLKGRKYGYFIFSSKEDITVTEYFSTYEEALETGLQEALKLISC